MSSEGGLPVVTVKGKPYDMGKEAGRKCASRGKAYRDSMAESVEYYTGMPWPKAVARGLRYLPFAEDFYPDFVEEIRGYAEGARMPFGDAFALCCHELLSTQGFKGCTDVAVSGDVTEDGHVLIGHNEDWCSEQLDQVVLLHAKPAGKPSFITTSYAGLVPSSGMNSAGLSLTGNALSPNDMRLGIPKVFPVRKALEARRIGEELEFAMPSGRASSYNNICSDKNGEIYSLEGSATDHAVLYAVDGYLVHTNHYVSQKMHKYEEFPDGVHTSTVRYHRALRLIRGQLGHVTVDSMVRIFRDHVNRPGSICRHADPKVHRLDISETIFSVIFDLTAMRAHICKGHPCTGTYSVFDLKKQD